MNKYCCSLPIFVTMRKGIFDNVDLGGCMKSRAFTLIELMIVVVIISFLAVLAVPQLIRYKARAYQAEVAVNLASLHTAQQTFFAQNGYYTSVLVGEDGLGWRPAGYQEGGKSNFHYTYGFNVPGAQEGVHYFMGKLAAPAASLGQTHAEKDGFTASASGDALGKGKVDVWTIDENRTIRHVHNGVE